LTSSITSTQRLTGPWTPGGTEKRPGAGQGRMPLYQQDKLNKNITEKLLMAEYVRHKMDTSPGGYIYWCRDSRYKQIKVENSDDYAEKLALCSSPEEEKVLQQQEHERYLSIWQDRDEIEFYEREKYLKKQAAAQSMTEAKSQLGGCLVIGLIICCPPAWPFAIMMLIFEGLFGRYSKPLRRR